MRCVVRHLISVVCSAPFFAAGFRRDVFVIFLLILQSYFFAECECEGYSVSIYQQISALSEKSLGKCFDFSFSLFGHTLSFCA